MMRRMEIRKESRSWRQVIQVLVLLTPRCHKNLSPLTKLFCSSCSSLPHSHFLWNAAFSLTWRWVHCTLVTLALPCIWRQMNY